MSIFSKISSLFTLRALLFLVLLFVSSVDGKQPAKFLDFSAKGPDYVALEDLRFAAADIAYIGREKVDILGRTYEASRYRLPVLLTVQVLCAVGSVNMSASEKRLANFDIFVVDDRNGAVRDALVEKMYHSWSKRELFSGEYYFDFSVHEDRYVLSAIPDLVNVKSFYVIWVNGRAVRIGFDGKADSGWGAMDSFTSAIFRISMGGVPFKAYQYPNEPRKKFIKLYEKGFFKSTVSGRGFELHAIQDCISSLF